MLLQEYQCDRVLTNFLGFRFLTILKTDPSLRDAAKREFRQVNLDYSYSTRDMNEWNVYDVEYNSNT